MSSEQRVHARIHVSTKIDVRIASGERIEAELKDLSKGGARIALDRAAGQVGDTVELFMPSLKGGEIMVTAQIIRHHADAGLQLYGVRFDTVEEDKQDQLLELIEVLLSASGGGRRAHPRVARRIEIRFGQLDDLRAILEDISAGGLLMTTAEPLVLYEELDVTVPDFGGGELIILHARVVNQRRADADGAWRVGLEFANLRPETKKVVQALLQSVLEALPPEAAADRKASEEPPAGT